MHNDIKLEEQLEKCALVVSDRNKVYEVLFKKELQKNIAEQDSSSNLIAQKNELIDTNKEITVEQVGIAKEKTDEKKLSDFDELEQNILNEAINSSIHIDINNYTKEVTEIEKIENQEPPESKEVKVSSERTFVNWFDKPKITEEVKSNSSIINQFLKEPKNKERLSSTVLSPSEMAKMSLVANTKFVTETLATIYAKQGQIDKAIEIYEQLSLKNPEKKTFFASRIRFLKEKQQYNK